jgi:rhodanese-related sulfurtransferase
VQFILDNWILFLAAFASGAGLLWQTFGPGAAGAGTISTAEAVRLINREKAVLIDVREAAEFAAGHAAGARSVPLSAIGAAAVKGLPTNKTLPLVVLCASGTRAGKAAALLRQQGYQNVQPLAGGIAAWREANLPVERAAA